METTNEEIHQATGIGVGFRDYKPTLLMTLIAGDRGYASLTKGNDLIWPNCMTWVRKDEEKAGQIVAGKGEAWHLHHAGLKIEKAGTVANFCGEFSLQRTGPKTAVFIKGNLRVELPVIENFPVVSVDWSNPALSHFRIDGFGLGPISRREFSNIYGRPEQSRIAAEHPLIGRLKNFGYSSSSASTIGISVRALADLDRLFTEGETEIIHLRFSNTVSIDAHLGTEESFIEAMLERYGAPSMVLTPPPGQLQLLSHMGWIWAHDLHGRFLSEGKDSENSCIKNLKNNSRGLRPNEHSHWSCGLVMILSAGSRPNVPRGQVPTHHFVVRYNILLFHGHAMAHHFFSDRLDVVEAAMRGEHLRNSNKPEIQPRPDQGRSRRGGRRQPN